MSKGTIRVYNKSKQTISLQARPPGGDFFLHEQQIRIPPRKTVHLNKSYLISEQVRNLQKRGVLQVIFDSDAD